MKQTRVSIKVRLLKGVRCGMGTWHTQQRQHFAADKSQVLNELPTENIILRYHIVGNVAHTKRK